MHMLYSGIIHIQGFTHSTIFADAPAPAPAPTPKIGAVFPHTPRFEKAAAPTPLKKERLFFSTPQIKYIFFFHKWV